MIDRADDQPDQRRESSVSHSKAGRLPWALLVAWSVGGIVVLQSIIGAVNVYASWSHLSDVAVVYPDRSPWAVLVALLVILAVGVLLIARRRIVFVPLVVYLALLIYTYFQLEAYPEERGIAAISIAEMLGVLMVALILQAFGKLK